MTNQSQLKPLNTSGANSRTCREEQADESEEFLKLFGAKLKYMQGQKTMSGKWKTNLSLTLDFKINNTELCAFLIIGL